MQRPEGAIEMDCKAGGKLCGRCSIPSVRVRGPAHLDRRVVCCYT